MYGSCIPGGSRSGTHATERVYVYAVHLSDSVYCEHLGVLARAWGHMGRKALRIEDSSTLRKTRIEKKGE